MCFSHVYDNVGVKANKQVYENPGELSDATPDLILAVKPKVPLQEDGQVRMCTWKQIQWHFKRFVSLKSLLEMNPWAVVIYG